MCVCWCPQWCPQRSEEVIGCPGTVFIDHGNNVVVGNQTRILCKSSNALNTELSGPVP